MLVLFPGALGDLCLAAPSIAAVASAGAQVELSVRRPLAPLVSMLLPNVALGLPFDGAAMATLFGGDVAPAVRAWIRDAERVIAFLARSADGAAVGRRLATLVASPELHAVPRADAAVHVAVDYARAFGLATLPPPIVAAAATTARPLPWRAAGAPRLVIHPGAGAVAKQWSRAGVHAVAETWTATGGEAVVLLGPAEERDAEWWRATGLPLAVDLTLADAAALIASAPSWVGNDAGMSHLAAALGRRGVVLFGPTRPERWMPRGGALTAVRFDGRSDAEVARAVVAALRTGSRHSA
jgi:ADP-heptose:LPS heptosyltransferase